MKLKNFKKSDEDFKNKENKILAKKNLISKDEINKEMKSLRIKFQKYRKSKKIEIEELKSKRNRNIVNFLNLINPIIEKYILDQSQSSKPNICFFPTASAESKDYIDNYYKAFSQLDCNPTHISLFSRTPDVKSEIEKALERDSPIEILKKRYASGEISEEEFNKIKKDLE